MNTLPNIEHIESLFKQTERFSDKEGKLFVPKILEAIDKVDIELIKLLLNDEKTKEQFFMKIDDVYVLNQNDLIEFFTMNEYFNYSFTSYTNKIGLIRKDNFIKKFDDVVLAFPYKDCVLEGGQTKDDDKKNEVFYNSIISRDEIDRLFEPKVLTNIKRYDKEGEHEVEEIREDDNLIIKGNNLLALHSLKKRYAGKVKLIYIDPPFNTGKDEFKYNDSFNHSTWLTFMKNRLEIARELLSDDGFISVHVGNEEAAYIQVLLDEIFTRECYLNHITMTTNAASGFKATSAKIFSTANHIFFYAKNLNVGVPNKIYIPKEYDKNYKYFLLNPEESYDKWKFSNIIDEIIANEELDNIKEFKKKYSANEVYTKMGIFANEHKERIFRTAAVGGGAKKKRQETLAKSKKERNKVFQHPNEDVDGFYILNGEQIVFWNNVYHEVDGENISATSLTDVWTDIGFTGIANEGGVTLKNGKKPEYLLRRILEMFTSKDDLIMDFHLGSGTTCAVAHKMGRRYIGIEQMDYIENLAVARLINVIGSEQSGISKIVGWKGGGSFVYAELKTIDTFKDTPINKLNKNMQYLPITELEDEDYNVSDEEIALNKKFYGLDDE